MFAGRFGLFIFICFSHFSPPLVCVLVYFFVYFFSLFVSLPPPLFPSSSRFPGRDSLPAAVGGEDEQQAMQLLLPMPFSVKMRELMLWATNTVLPVMARARGGAGGVAKAGGEAGTPGELGWAGLGWEMGRMLYFWSMMAMAVVFSGCLVH